MPMTAINGVSKSNLMADAKPASIFLFQNLYDHYNSESVRGEDQARKPFSLLQVSYAAINNEAEITKQSVRIPMTAVFAMRIVTTR